MNNYQMYEILKKLEHLRAQVKQLDLATKQKAKAQQPATKQKSFADYAREASQNIGMLGIYRR